MRPGRQDHTLTRSQRHEVLLSLLNVNWQQKIANEVIRNRVEANRNKASNHGKKLNFFGQICIISGDILITRKLSYGKDDRAMRPIYGCHENFRQSLRTPTATFPKLLMGFCSD